MAKDTKIKMRLNVVFKRVIQNQQDDRWENQFKQLDGPKSLVGITRKRKVINIRLKSGSASLPGDAAPLYDA